MWVNRKEYELLKKVKDSYDKLKSGAYTETYKGYSFLYKGTDWCGNSIYVILDSNGNLYKDNITIKHIAKQQIDELILKQEILAEVKKLMNKTKTKKKK